MFKLAGSKLRTVEKLTQDPHHHSLLSSCRFILLQHLFEDTLEFVQYLTQAGVAIDYILGKEYTSESDILEQLQKLSIQVKQVQYESIESNDFLYQILIQSLQKAKQHQQKVIVHELGGYFSKAIQQIPTELKPYFAGVVEGTTFGYQRYKQIEASLDVPIMHVARSSLKEIESYFVGESITLAFNNMMRSLGLTIQGAEALVVGYGMIGEKIAKSLQLNLIHPTVYDKDPLKMLKARIEGYRILRPHQSLDQYDLVISATGNYAVSLDMMRAFKSGVILISGGSKDIEFDRIALEKAASKVRQLRPEVKVYTLNQKEIILLSNGTALNFRERSVPTEIFDIVYAEILTCIIELLKNQSIHAGLSELGELQRSQIASYWLELHG
ncbi:adenosylhomocysteinase [Seinonella peptonophila]|uniref:Adenosylhomocysteinase n=1 Tax=Seinonella peptonophila TaxID=112248 RepID=A0A1M4Y4X4_9BACL|nr:adenosylhomocysteinase [Seinonella peptonophila]SHF00729.1 adenosylhomocysteinase [Seinonella peptonophila]